MLRVYILATRVLSAWPIIMIIMNDEMSFKALSTDLSHIKTMAVLYLMALCSGTVNYTAGGIGKGCPHILVAVGIGARGSLYLGQRI